MLQEKVDINVALAKKNAKRATELINEEINETTAWLEECDIKIGELKSKLAKEEADDREKEKYEKELIGFSQDVGVVKKEKETRYLTIQGLLDHPYFIAINEADISIVIDEFEKLQQPNYDN